MLHCFQRGGSYWLRFSCWGHIAVLGPSWGIFCSARPPGESVLHRLERRGRIWLRFSCWSKSSSSSPTTALRRSRGGRGVTQVAIQLQRDQYP